MSEQQALFGWVQTPHFAGVAFAGSDYDRQSDDKRLSGQIARVYDFMADGRWHTLPEIEAATGDPAASISAQLRHLRKERFGSHTIEKRPRGDRERGLWEYRMDGDHEAA